MELQVVTISHAPIELREVASFRGAKKLSFYDTLSKQGIDNAMILSTCNRSEVYAVVNKGSDAFYKLCQKHWDSSLHAYMTWKKGKEAIHHGLRVCAGLDSMILGEDQIFHQMKEAYAYAHSAGMIHKELHLYFQSVFNIIKELKTTWKLSEQPLTTSYVAWQLIRKYPKYENANILLCGSGEVIQEFFPYLKQHKGNVILASRNEYQAREFQKQYPFLQWIPINKRFQSLIHKDILISATSSPHLMFPYRFIHRPMLMLDLALPRDIDSAYHKDKHIRLYDIDDVQKTLIQAKSNRDELAKEAEIFLAKASEKLDEEWHKLKQEPLVAATQKQLLHMAEDTYALLDKKLHLQPHEQKIMKKTLEYSFTRYMKQMIAVLETLDLKQQQSYLHVLKQLQQEERE